MKGVGVKRDVLLKGPAHHRIGGKQPVNDVQWAKQAAGEQDCQSRVDVKALTGRGRLGHLRQQVATLDGLVQAMRELAQQSKDVPGLSIYLVVHQRSESGYVFLRWRARTGSNRHLSWEEVEQMGQPSFELRRWCSTASKQAQQLNARHLEVRGLIRRIRQDVDNSEPHMFPRASFPTL